VTLVMPEHASQRQHEEEREEKKVTSADEKHERCEQQPVDGEPHQCAWPDGLRSSFRGIWPIWRRRWCRLLWRADGSSMCCEF
jgi:hypothetical protein